MPVSVISSDARIDVDRAYFNTSIIRNTGAGSTLRGKHRDSFLSDSGIDDTSAPLSLFRHLLPKGVKRSQAQAIRKAHDGSAMLVDWSGKGCPALESLGIESAAQYAAQVRNGEKSADGIALRASTYQCPYCMAPSIAADVKAGRRELSKAHLAALRSSQ